MNTTSRSVLFLLIVGSATPAMAGGFSTARFGGEDGHAASDSVTSVYYNPAGLALGKGTRIYLEGTFAYRTVDYDRDEGTIDNPGTGTPDDATAANAGPATLGNFIASPFAGVVTDFGKRGLAVAAALYVPFGGQAKWDQNPDFEGNSTYPGAVDGPARWANIEGSQRNVYVTLGVAKSSPGHSVSVGAGLNIVMSEISLVRARNATGTDDLVTPTGSVSEGRSLLEVKSTDVSIGLGAMWLPSTRARLGISYQIKPGFGEQSLDGTLENKFGTSPETSIPVSLRQRLPDILRVAGEFRANEKVKVRISADWQRWSAFGNQCLLDTRDPAPSCRFTETGALDVDNGGAGVVVNLPRDWKDTFGVRAGAWARLNDKMGAGGSLSFDSSAVPDETMDPSLFDMNKVIIQLGGRYLMSDKLFLNATLGHVLYMSRTTEPRAVDPTEPSRNPDMAGTYKSAVTFGMIGVGIAL